MDIFDKCKNFTTAKEIIKAGYYPYFKRIQTAQNPEVIIEGKKVIVACSNNYLGLTTHPKVKKAATLAIKKYGTSCTGSRFLSGTLKLHEDVEEKFADFVNKEAAVLFTTGHHSNLGAIAALVERGEVVITDKLDHASIIDGCKLSYGEMARFKHNDMDDLERVLKKYKEKNKLIIVDGVFSMEGDIANLPAIVELAKIYNARVMVDDAHAFGVLGKNGRGTTEHFGIDTDIIMTTASKSLASIGGFIASNEYVVHYIKHHARALIFTASLPPAQLAAIDASLDIIKEEPEIREKLWRNVKNVKNGLDSLGFDTRNSQSAIIPITVGDWRKTMLVWKMLYDYGVFTSPVLPPAVPEGQALIRTSYMASHTDKHINLILESFERVGKEMGIIAGSLGPRGRVILKRRRLFKRLKVGTKHWFRRMIRGWR